MADFTLNTSSTTSRTLSGTDVGIIGPNGALTVIGSFPVYANGTSNRLLVNGSILGDQGAVVFNGGAFELSVGQDGTILSTGASAVAAVATSPLDITNAGLIQGDIGISLQASGGSVSFDVFNSGVINGQSTGIQLAPDGAETTVVNSGTINAEEWGIRVTTATSSRTYIVNSGTISAETVAITGADAAGSGFYEGADFVTNTGTITGDVQLGSGNDTFDSVGGTVNGTVSGGLGNDTYIIDDPTVQLSELSDQGNDVVYNFVSYTLTANFEGLWLQGSANIDGTGNDLQNAILGNSGHNRLSGGNSRDTLLGEGGNDTLDGGRGDDDLRGGDGDDTVIGRAGHDVIDGGEGEDFLFGGLGNDTILGDSGDDTIKGGLGSDDMEGGGGQDSFVFTRVSDSPSGGSDLIRDFVPGQDALDFSEMPGGDYTVSILGAYTGAGPSIRTSENTSGDTIVWVDADGDGSTDMRIALEGVTGVTASDFLL